MNKIIIVVSMFLAAISCSPKEKVDSNVLKIGLLAPITGVNSEYGVGFEIATQMAADEINANGGINGKMLEIVVRDSKGDQKESSDLARQFVDNEEILAIVGDFTSGASMANAPIIDEAGIVQLSPTASNPDYAGMSPYAFSIMGRQDVEAPYFAKYVVSKYMGLKKVAAIYINSDWGKGSYDGFVKQAEIEGIDIVESVHYVQDEKDFSSLITKLRASDPDVVCIFDQGAVPQIINQIRSVGWDIPLASLGPGTSQQILDLSGENAEGILITTPFFFNENNEVEMKWYDEFLEKSGFAPTVHPVVAYDAVFLLAKAMEMSGDNITRESIKENLSSLSKVDDLLGGPIEFSKDGDVFREYLITGVENGKFVIKEGFDYANE